MQKQGIFLFSKTVQSDSGANSVSCLLRTGVIYGWKSSGGVKLTTPIHPNVKEKNKWS